MFGLKFLRQFYGVLIITAFIFIFFLWRFLDEFQGKVEVRLELVVSPTATLLTQKQLNQSNQTDTTRSVKPRNNATKNQRANAVIVVLAQEDQFYDMQYTLAMFEFAFNSRYHYPYVILNNKPFSKDFEIGMRHFLMEKYHDTRNPPTRNVSFGVIPKEHWSYPDWIDQVKAKENRNTTTAFKNGIESYHHMCRYFSGFLHHHPLLQPFDYFWRVEPGVGFFCKLEYDPFVFMMENDIKYGFTIVTREEPLTVPTLWNTTKEFLKDVYPSVMLQPPNSSIIDLFLSNTENNTRNVKISDFLNSSTVAVVSDYTWNLCNIYNNFEIASFSFFRSVPYQSYFEYLDRAGGFYYERWGDSPVHTLAVAMFLDRSEIHHFADIGYQHDEWQWCPPEKAFAGDCFCNAYNWINLAYAEEGSCQLRITSGLRQDNV